MIDRSKKTNQPEDFIFMDEAELEDLLKHPQAERWGGFLSNDSYLGMSASQRLVISGLVFLLVCVVGAMLMVLRSLGLI